MISSKFAAFLQNTISEEHLWNAASGHLHYNTKHTVFRFLSLSLSSIPLLYEDSPSYSLHSHPSFSCIPTLVPIIPTLISRIPIIPFLITRIPRIPTLIPHILCIPIIPLFPFPDFPFRLLQIVGLLN